MMHRDNDEHRRRPQRDELIDAWPLKAALALALGPYFLLLTAACLLPLRLGGMDKPTNFPSLLLCALLLPLTVVQAGLAFVFSPLLYWDYTRYLESIGERGKELPHNPEEGTHHGVATWLFTRYIEQPLFKIDTLQPDARMLREAEGAAGGKEKGRRYLLTSLPPRKGDRPVIMQVGMNCWGFS